MKTQTRIHSVNRKRSSRKNSACRNSPRKPLSIYFAGDLWTHKDLIGNALLASHIEKRSKNRKDRYQCVLPQNLEQSSDRAVFIRNQDLKKVMECDVCIFNFDGTDLDSGTVVEFIYAKMLDIPCVILRTDFRSAGDGLKDSDPWNLMVSGWPRAKVLNLHGMAEYQAAAHKHRKIEKTVDALYTKLADAIVEALDAVRAEPSLIADKDYAALYDWALQFPANGMEQVLSKPAVEKLIAAKKSKGLI